MVAIVLSLLQLSFLTFGKTATCGVPRFPSPLSLPCSYPEQRIEKSGHRPTDHRYLAALTDAAELARETGGTIGGWVDWIELLVLNLIHHTLAALRRLAAWSTGCG